MKLVYRLLIVLQLLVGTGAVSGGLAAIINPVDPLGITVEALKNSPFDSFLIPGIILFAVIGLGNVFSAILFRFKLKWQGYISSIFSWAIVFWIVVQCIMLNVIAPPHVIVFVIGLINAVLSLIIMFEKQLFPTNIIISLYRKIGNRSEGV